MNRSIARPIAVGIALVLVVLLAACSSNPHPDPTGTLTASAGDRVPVGTSPGGGAALPEQQCQPGSGPLALAMSGRMGSPSPQLPADVLAAANRSAANGAPISLVNTDGKPTVIATATFASTAGTDVAQRRALKDFITGLDAAAQSLRATAPQVDDLAALTLAARTITDATARTGQRGTVVLMDSGLQTLAPLNYTAPGLLDAPADDVVAFLQRLDAIPKLTGLTVVLYVGDTAPPQAPLDSGRRARLIELYTKIAIAGGAACVRTPQAPLSGIALQHMPLVDAVPVPPLGSWHGNDTPPVVLPSDSNVGFLPDLATFRDPAAVITALIPQAQFLAANPTRTVTVTGTTSSAGDPNDNTGRIRLSTARARAVKDQLVRLGVTPDRITTAGVGTDFPGFINDRAADGTLLPGPAAANRSVILTVNHVGRP